jgi:uncharacterized protein
MVSNIFVNLPVKDLPRTMSFFSALGFSFNPQFTGETAGCLMLGPNMFAMLLTEQYFQTFTPKAIADAHKASEVLVALGVASSDDVKRIAGAAFANGATRVRDPQDLGFMYSEAFADLDGHIWELVWMDQAAVQ